MSEKPASPAPDPARQPRPRARSDAKLLTLPAERQAQIWEWCRKPNDRDADGKVIPGTGGLAFAQAQLAADGMKVALSTLSEACRVWELGDDFASADTEEREIVKFLQQFPGITADAVAATGQLAFTLAAKRSRDREGWIALEKLRLEKETAALTAELEKAKLALRERQVAQKDEQIVIERVRLDVLLNDAAAKLLDKAIRARADEINASDMSNAEKIAAMRRAAFAEIDALQASGKVVIPE
jgi:hypothetical protein